MIYIFCLYNFSVKCIINKNYLRLYPPLKWIYTPIKDPKLYGTSPIIRKTGRDEETFAKFYTVWF